ncbi:MAG: prepilin-type N-terminal cleavage/methylation domain-containing protein, partial [Sedimentisphaerales bacterium]|nr:prepilin-type N-terminal cleavage/methylation domain-containing protein [Sedimentisphaerales bacterium]
MITNSQTHHCISKRGFTLTEAMMAVVVLGIAAASLLLPFISGAAVRAEGVNRTLAARLASDLMEEVINTPFDQILSSYNYSEPQGQVKDATGAIFDDSAYANFSRNVTCEYVYVPPQPA